MSNLSRRGPCAGRELPHDRGGIAIARSNLQDPAIHSLDPQVAAVNHEADQGIERRPRALGAGHTSYGCEFNSISQPLRAELVHPIPRHAEKAQ